MGLLGKHGAVFSLHGSVDLCLQLRRLQLSFPNRRIIQATQSTLSSTSTVCQEQKSKAAKVLPLWAYSTFEDSQPDELTEEGLLSVRNPFPNWNHLFLFCQLAIYWKLCHLLFRSTYSMVHGNRVSRFTINEVHPVTMAAKWAGGAFMQSPRHITVKDVCSENRMRCFPWAQMATF